MNGWAWRTIFSPGQAEIINQDIEAEQKHPEREDQYNPVDIAPAQEEQKGAGESPTDRHNRAAILWLSLSG